MAAAQEILKRGRRVGRGEEQEVIRSILEEAVYGFDVVPAAIHLAASTLCMAEARAGYPRHEFVAGATRRGG